VWLMVRSTFAEIGLALRTLRAPFSFCSFQAVLVLYDYINETGRFRTRFELRVPISCANQRLNIIRDFVQVVSFASLECETATKQRS
jgi:hypothetical protein